MADRDPIWSFGESQLLYSPTTGLDATWSLGESFIFDEYEAAGGENKATKFAKPAAIMRGMICHMWHELDAFKPIGGI